MPIVSALEEQRQENCYKFKASLGYRVSHLVRRSKQSQNPKTHFSLDKKQKPVYQYQ